MILKHAFKGMIHVLVLLLPLALSPFLNTAFAQPTHAIAMHGAPALPVDFLHLPYVNPNAMKGGRLTLGQTGSFDGLNPFIVKGVTAPQTIRDYVIEPLMRRSLDEPFSLYGLIAQSIETPADRSFVSFTLHPKATFSDGTQITAADVRFTFELLRDKGRPNFRTTARKVAKVEVLNERTIRFDFKEPDFELPLILGLMPVFPRHATDPSTFDQTSFKPPLGSGPYIVADVKPGQSIAYRRNPSYWGADLPVNRGLYNVDELKIDYYRDENSLFEAFKAGLLDARFEQDPTRWLTGYDIPAIREGRIIKEALPSRTPKGMSSFVFNTRRPIFADIRVREALSFLFDFEWVNRNLYGGVYTRTGSFFDASDLSSRGRPASAQERALLAPFPNAVRADILDGSWQPPSSDGSGRDREQAKRALALLGQAGFTLKDEGLHNASGEPLAFEILVASREQERLALNYSQGLSRIGVQARVRLVDSVQYERRRQRFDYDMIIANFPVSPSPGNEQIFRWGSATAEREGSFNFAGARSPATDAMIDAMLRARTREEFVEAVRALDRTLLSGFYIVPLYHLSEQWLARASGLKRPETVPLLGAAFETWWRKEL